MSMALLSLDGKRVSCRGIVFDKDGTLMDSLKIWPRLIRTRAGILEKKLNLTTEITRLTERVMGLEENDRIALRSVIVIGTREQTAAAVNALLYLHLGLPWDSGLAAILAAFDEADLEVDLASQAIPMFGTLEMLSALHKAGVKIAVATNDSLLRTRSLLEAAKMSPFISACACRDEVREGKPAPALFRLACERLELEPQECLAVGDSLLDIEMGRAGRAALTVGVLTGASIFGELDGRADVILKSVSEIRPA
ncbi:phosphoglycolate phosphatase [Peptococcaceae bacterium CEB3]|nr:phosphoglycolate phosphatase [Peptococcaceae bacterium CEB3]